LINHPISGYIDFRIEGATASDLKGRKVVVTVLGGETIEGVRIPYFIFASSHFFRVSRDTGT
jgi:hypothetical protein